MTKKNLGLNLLVLLASGFFMGATVAETPNPPAESVQETAAEPAGAAPVESAAEPVELAAPVKPAVSADNILSEARQLVQNGELLAAKEKYKKFLTRDLSSDLKKDIRKELEDLNIKILFSKTITPGSIIHDVKSGDSLYKIAKDHNTTVGFIVRSNQLKGFTIYPGQKLKVVIAPFSIKVRLSKNKLYLYQGEELIKTYNVATGHDKATPVGEFTIENKLVNPTWYKAGAVVPPDSPENILGTRWMGFTVPGYGIHGTTKPESIGKNVSAGCVRMLNEDVEVLYDIVPAKTKVTILK